MFGVCTSTTNNIALRFVKNVVSPECKVGCPGKSTNSNAENISTIALLRLSVWSDGCVGMNVLMFGSLLVTVGSALPV